MSRFWRWYSQPFRDLRREWAITREWWAERKVRIRLNGYCASTSGLDGGLGTGEPAQVSESDRLRTAARRVGRECEHGIYPYRHWCESEHGPVATEAVPTGEDTDG